jgi:hypothetical protein
MIETVELKEGGINNNLLWENTKERCEKKIEPKQINPKQLNIDTEVGKLSSRKLWQLLKLNAIKACSLDTNFIEEIKNELIARCDYDEELWKEGHVWSDPH